jgi:CheY-like chemotaxis protein
MTIENELEILLVENNPRDAELAMRALKKRKLANHIVWVKDGAEAIQYIFPSDEHDSKKIYHKPKLILLDLKLPKVDGLEVLRRLKGDEQTRMIPTVVLTSSLEERNVVESYRLGVNSYIVKPVDFENFSKAVEQLGMYWLLLNLPPQEPSRA